MTGTSQLHTEARRILKLASALRAMVVTRPPSPSLTVSAASRPRWLRASGARTRSTTVATPTTTTAAATARATDRHDSRRPAKATMARVNTIGRASMPPTSSPRPGAPSTTTTRASTAPTATRASLRRGACSRCSAAASRAVAAMTANVGFPTP